MTAPMTPTKVVLQADPNRVGKIAKLAVVVVARDATGAASKFDLAELDDASAAIWLDSVKDWKLKLKYRYLLHQVWLGQSPTVVV